MRPLLTPGEIQEIERRLGAEGVTAAEVLAIFRARGVALSEGTFRKYVQAGLLPRSRRVGSKGKHRGSRGVYPISVVRRLNAIKAMMASGMTLDQVRGSFLYLRGELDVVEGGLAEIGRRLEEAIAAAEVTPGRRERLEKDLARIRDSAARLTERIERLAGQLVAARAVAEAEPEWEGS